MKKIIMYLWLIGLATSFSACYKAKEDRFDHKYPIYKTYFDDTKTTPSIYTYQHKKLTKITLSEGDYLMFSYKKNFQVEKIIHCDIYDAIIDYATISFNNDNISEINLYTAGNILTGRKVFSIENKKIGKVIDYIPKEMLDKSNKSVLFDLFFADNQDYINILKNDQSKDNLVMATTTAVFYTGDNITQLKVYIQQQAISEYNYGKDTIIVDYTYDANPNPYYGLNFYCKSFLGYSANNPITAYFNHKVVEDKPSSQNHKEEYHYVFDKHKNPTIIRKTSTDQDKAEQTTYIEYLSK